VSDASTELATLDAALAGHAPLPRSNGELVFDEPWQGRALGLGVALLDRLDVRWPEFRDHLVAAIAQRPRDPRESDADAYYGAWLDAVEALLAARDGAPTRPAR
jgi:nitrile hydratase accessory protein